MPTPPPPQLPGIDLSREKACLFTPRGELLWRSPAWTAGKRCVGLDCTPCPPESLGACAHREQQVLGTRYFEFIFPEDLPGLLAFFADGRPGAHRFRAFGPASGVYVESHYEKIAHGANWLVFAVAVPTVARPGGHGAGLISAAVALVLGVFSVPVPVPVPVLAA